MASRTRRTRAGQHFDDQRGRLLGGFAEERVAARRMHVAPTLSRAERDSSGGLPMRWRTCTRDCARRANRIRPRAPGGPPGYLRELVACWVAGRRRRWALASQASACVIR
jgi:hypothetical protein